MSREIIRKLNKDIFTPKEEGGALLPARAKEHGFIHLMEYLRKGGKPCRFVVAFGTGMGGETYFLCKSVAYNTKENRGIIRGLKDAKFIPFFEKHNIPYYYIDTGYFGNNVSLKNDRAGKQYHRVAYNAFQCSKIKTYPYGNGDWHKDIKRFAHTSEELKPWQMKDNGRILLCPPSLKSLKGYRLGNEKLYDKYKREWKERGRTNKGVNTPLNLISEKD